MDIHEDTGFQTNHCSERATFRIGQSMVTFSRGDVPVVCCLVHGIGFSATTGFFKISTDWEHYFGCSKIQSACRFHNLYVQILFDANLLSILGLNIIILLSYNQPLPVLLFCHQQPIQTNRLLLRNTTLGPWWF